MENLNGKFVLLVGIVGIYQGSILILQRSSKLNWLPGVWSLPAGKVQLGEDLEAAAHKELWEETHLSGEILDVAGVSEFKGFRNETFLHNVQITYLMRLNENKVVLNSENDNFSWIASTEVSTSKLDDYNKQLLERVLTRSKHWKKSEWEAV